MKRTVLLSGVVGCLALSGCASMTLRPAHTGYQATRYEAESPCPQYRIDVTRLRVQSDTVLAQRQAAMIVGANVVPGAPTYRC